MAMELNLSSKKIRGFSTRLSIVTTMVASFRILNELTIITLALDREKVST